MNAVERLTNELTRLPGIGRKTAQRITFFLMKVNRERALALSEAIVALKDKVGYCSVCFNVTETDPCTICSDSRRDRSLLCVVEEPSDLQALERSGKYAGLYHTLGGHLSPLDGAGPEDLRIKELMARVKENEVREVILACNPTLEGESTALYLARLLEPLGVKTTRIARGLPMGGDLELADEVTLARAMEGRQEMTGENRRG